MPLLYPDATTGHATHAIPREPSSMADARDERLYFLKANTSYRDQRQDPGPRQPMRVPVMSGVKSSGGARIRGGVI